MPYLKNFLLLSLGLYIIYFVTGLLFENTQEIWGVTSSVSKIDIVIGFFFYLLSHALRVMRLVILSANPSINIKSLLSAQMKANGVNLILPFKIGEAYRLISFKRFFGTYSNSFSILLCERFLDIILITLFLVLSVIASDLDVELLSDLMLLSIFILFIIFFLYFSLDEILLLTNRLFVGKESTVLNLRIVKGSSRLINILRDTKSILSSKIFSCLSITLMIWTFEVLVFYFLLSSLELNNFIIVFLTVSVALSSLLPSGPAGYGGIQLAFYLVGFSIGFEDLILYSFVYNIYIFGSAIAISGILFLIEFLRSMVRISYE
jgi:uncharacterized protein (TIRG00374 family)